MNRIDRLQAILIQLQSKKVVKAQEIADRFAISLRTVYRDVRALEEAGVPIGAEAGVGYFIMEGYHLPPVLFSNTEAQALLLGAKLIEIMTDQSVDSAFQSALFKIKSVLKTHSKEKLEDLEQRIAIVKNPRLASQTFDNHFLADIQHALVQHQVLSIEYFSSYNTEFTHRHIEPIGLLHYSSGWHLIAYCQLRNDYRDFRVDRIKTLDMTAKTFRSRPTDSIQDYMNSIVHTQQLQQVVLVFDKSVVRYVESQKYGYGFVSQQDLGEQVRMHFLTSHLDALAHWLLMYINTVVVESPLTLKTTIQKLVLELQQHYLAATQTN